MEAIAAARRLQPDVVIMDVRLPDGSGVEACREIRAARPETRVVMLTSFADEEAVVAAIVAGAAGYLLKGTDPRVLVETVATIAGGQTLLDPDVTERVLEWVKRVAAQGADNPLAGLSQQQRKILPLIVEGKTNRQIAAALHLSEHTVKDYVGALLHKLNLTRRVEAAAFVARHRWPSEA
ncbi:MAG: response regulator transcription factor [Chloroflexota bacterium]|nr:response regulator transcription factor [Chloroflexota bacterium]